MTSLQELLDLIVLVPVRKMDLDLKWVIVYEPKIKSLKEIYRRLIFYGERYDQNELLAAKEWIESCLNSKSRKSKKAEGENLEFPF